MKHGIYRLTLILIASVAAMRAGDSVVESAVARASQIGAEIAKSGATLDRVRAAELATGQIWAGLSEAGNAGLASLRSLSISIAKSKITEGELNCVATWEMMISVFSKSTNPNCWSDVDRGKLKAATNEVFNSWALWIKSLRDIVIVGYIEQVNAPPALPASIAASYYGGVPEPCVIKDPNERGAYAKLHDAYKAIEKRNIVQRNLPALIKQAEAVLYGSMASHPAKEIVDRKFIINIMTRSGATKERLAELEVP
jgi:hypothetical protein